MDSFTQTLFEAATLFWFAYLGGSIGSFSHVVASRLPRGQSIVSPGSHCPQCLTPIRWHDNIPILGWFFVRGHCRSCGWPIPAHYVGVEILFALVFVIFYFLDLRTTRSLLPLEFLLVPRWDWIARYTADTAATSLLIILLRMGSEGNWKSDRHALRFLGIASLLVASLSLLALAMNAKPEQSLLLSSADILLAGLLGFAAAWFTRRPRIATMLGWQVRSPLDSAGLIFVGLVVGTRGLACVVVLLICLGVILKLIRRPTLIAAGILLAHLVVLIATRLL